MTIAVPTPGLRPGTFLKDALGQPRGFAARGREWVACAGSIAEACVDGGAGVDRFERLKQLAKRIVGATEMIVQNPSRSGDGTVPPGTESPSVRFYGGFPFAERSDRVRRRGPTEVPSGVALDAARLGAPGPRRASRSGNGEPRRASGSGNGGPRRASGRENGSNESRPAGRAAATGGIWEGFSTAVFHLPRFELEGEGRLAVLKVNHALDEPLRSNPIGKMVSDAQELRDRLLELEEKRSTTVPPSPLGPVAAELNGTTRAAWDAGVSSILSRIEAGRLRKVVLARTLDIVPTVAVDPVDVVDHLWNARDESHSFFIEPRAGSVLVGAAPETVTTVRGRRFFATAVAGSTGRGRDGAEDKRLANALLASEKDRGEQEMVVSDMVSRLEDFCTEVRFDEHPRVLRLDTLQHLETQITAVVPDGVGALEILARLHPTPAVCGLPRPEALSVLREAEDFDRGWYAGPVGWFDTDGNGSFVPALRTGASNGNGWRLFAGAGIVSGSDAESEWRETGMKFTPMLRALAQAGLDLPGRASEAGF